MGIAQRDYMRDPSRPGLAAITKAVPIIMGINVVVFIAWFFAKQDVSLWETMKTHFTVSLYNVKHGHFWTPLTSAFSHIEFPHLLLNMFVLYGFGSALEDRWGTRRFVIFYLLAGVIASLAHVSLTFLPMWSDTPAVGASGAISGLLIAYSFLFPRHKILLFFVLPVPAIVGALFFMGWDLWFLVKQANDPAFRAAWNIGHGAHLGGALFGIAYYFAFLSGGRTGTPRRRRKRLREVEVDYTDAEASRMDFLLGKVKQGGLDALTPEERDFMIRMSEKMRREGRR